MFTNPIRLLRDPSALAMAGMQGGANILSQGLNWALTEASNKKQRKWNEKMYALTRQHSLDDWHMQNEYNHPSAVMARFRDAKLNPNLIYGNGTDTAAGVPRGANPQPWSPKAPQVDIGMAARESLSGYYDTRLKEGNIDLQKKQGQVLQEEAMLKQIQGYSELIKSDMNKFDLSQKERLKDISASTAEAMLNNLKKDYEKKGLDMELATNADIRAAVMQSQNIRESLARIEKMRIDNSKTEEEKKHIRKQMKQIDEVINSSELKRKIDQLELKLKEKGLSWNDNYALRMITIASDEQKTKEQKEKEINDLIRNWYEGNEEDDPIPPNPNRGDD